jgi:hypothetical protein
MYVDGFMLLAIYMISVIALAVSVYALWTVVEVEDEVKKKNVKLNKLNNAWDHYHNPKNQKKSQPKGYFDKYK